MEEASIAVTGPADRLVVATLQDLRPLFERHRGHVLILGGLMTRLWLHLRPLEGIGPRATADVDIGVDKRGLKLTANSEKLAPLLRELKYEPGAYGEPFRFSKTMENGAEALVDLVVAKGASRHEPPLLEKGISTVAAPGLAYAVSRGPRYATVEFVDGVATAVFELPLPTLDAALVLKGALVASDVRMQADRKERDTVDTVLLAAAAADDREAMVALSAGRAKSSEARRATEWLVRELGSPTGAAARRMATYLRREQGIGEGGEWAAGVAAAFGRALDPDSTPR